MTVAPFCESLLKNVPRSRQRCNDSADHIQLPPVSLSAYELYGLHMLYPASYQITQLQDELKAANDDGKSLVDSEGFPRADVDVHAARHCRSQLANLRNDLSDVRLRAFLYPQPPAGPF